MNSVGLLEEAAWLKKDSFNCCCDHITWLNWNLWKRKYYIQIVSWFIEFSKIVLLTGKASVMLQPKLSFIRTQERLVLPKFGSDFTVDTGKSYWARLMPLFYSNWLYWGVQWPHFQCSLRLPPYFLHLLSYSLSFAGDLSDLRSVCENRNKMTNKDSKWYLR